MTDVHTQPAEMIRVGADELTFRVASAQTEGAIFAAEVRLPAGGGPPALHRHAPAEVYRVDSGELAIYVEDDGGDIRRLVTGPGAVVPIPGGRAHTVRNESGAEALAYVVFAPGTEMERFVRAAGALAAEGPPDPGDVMELAERHGIEMAGVMASSTSRPEPHHTTLLALDHSAFLQQQVDMPQHLA